MMLIVQPGDALCRLARLPEEREGTILPFTVNIIEKKATRKSSLKEVELILIELPELESPSDRRSVMLPMMPAWQNGAWLRTFSTSSPSARQSTNCCAVRSVLQYWVHAYCCMGLVLQHEASRELVDVLNNPQTRLEVLFRTIFGLGPPCPHVKFDRAMILSGLSWSKWAILLRRNAGWF